MSSMWLAITLLRGARMFSRLSPFLAKPLMGWVFLPNVWLWHHDLKSWNLIICGNREWLYMALSNWWHSKVQILTWNRFSVSLNNLIARRYFKLWDGISHNRHSRIDMRKMHQSFWQEFQGSSVFCKTIWIYFSKDFYLSTSFRMSKLRKIQTGLKSNWNCGIITCGMHVWHHLRFFDLLLMCGMLSHLFWDIHPIFDSSH